MTEKKITRKDVSTHTRARMRAHIHIPLKWKEEDFCLRIEKSKILPNLLIVLYSNHPTSSTYPILHIVKLTIIIDY